MNPEDPEKEDGGQPVVSDGDGVEQMPPPAGDEPPLTLDEPVSPPPPPPPPQWPPRHEGPPPSMPPARKKKRPGGLGGLVKRVLVLAVVLVVVLPVTVTAIYRFVPPPFTILMVQRLFEGKGWDYRWRSIDRMSPALVQAAIAAEDARFCSHDGFDFEAMEKAWNNNKKGGRVKGGSTISQQTAKNVFLWPQRSYVRKGLEAYYTVLIEKIWGKRRIMEVYLNVAEMGSGTYGAEAAARRYFGVSADQLTRAQAARLVAILPNPLKYKAVKPGKYVAGRSRRIGAAAGTVRNDGLAACVGRMRKATAAETAEPVTPSRPTPRKAAPEKKSDPLPTLAPADPAPEVAPPEIPAPTDAPVFETPQNSD